MPCNDYIVDGIASVNYVDCAVNTVSGTLQTQIDNSIIWEELSSTTHTGLVKTDVITINNLPEKDFLRLVIHVQGLSGSSFGFFNIKFNDNGSNYQSSNSFGDGYFLPVDTSRDGFYEIIISNFVNRGKFVYTCGTSFQSSVPSTFTSNFRWNDTSQKITRIDFRFSGGSLSSASLTEIKIKILGMDF